MEEFFHFRSYSYKFIIFSGTVFVCLWTQDNIEKIFLLFCLWWSTAPLTSAILQRSWINDLLCWKCPPPASTLYMYNLSEMQRDKEGDPGAYTEDTQLPSASGAWISTLPSGGAQAVLPAGQRSALSITYYKSYGLIFFLLIDSLTTFYYDSQNSKRNNQKENIFKDDYINIPLHRI